MSEINDLWREVRALRDRVTALETTKPEPAKDAEGPKTHELKTWPEPFSAVRKRVKNYEIRKFDRPFMVGDPLLLREWDPATGSYTGNRVVRYIAHMTVGPAWGIPDGLCVLGLR